MARILATKFPNMPKFNRTPRLRKAATGVVTRIVGDSLAYATLTNALATQAFVASAVEGFKGETLNGLGVIEGTHVQLKWGSDPAVVTKVAILPISTLGSSARITPTRNYRPAERANLIGRIKAGNLTSKRKSAMTSLSSGARRTLKVVASSFTGTGSIGTSNICELNPTDHPIGERSIGWALPVATRKFGKLLNTDDLWPGDLVLTREVKPGRVSRTISEVQVEGGYSTEHSKWTHAAMYLGDGENVVEATFDEVFLGGSVRITNLNDLCEGSTILRVRRSSYVLTPQEGWRMCVRALGRLKEEYSLSRAISMWFDVKVMKVGFYSEEMRRSASPAVVCSTLYADAYNLALHRNIGEANGSCVPAYLSGSAEFVDRHISWVAIK